MWAMPPRLPYHPRERPIRHREYRRQPHVGLWSVQANRRRQGRGGSPVVAMPSLQFRAAKCVFILWCFI